MVKNQNGVVDMQFGVVLIMEVLQEIWEKWELLISLEFQNVLGTGIEIILKELNLQYGQLKEPLKA